MKKKQKKRKPINQAFVYPYFPKKQNVTYKK